MSLTDTSGERNAGLALAAGCAAVIGWSIGPLLIRSIEASTTTKIVFRIWLAQPVMFAVAYFTGGRLSRDLVRRAILPGVLFGGTLTATFFAFDNTTIANATLIPALQPALFLIVGPRMFGDRTSRRQRNAGVLALVGVVVFVLSGTGGGNHSFVGDLAAVADLLIWTTYFILVKRARDDGAHASAYTAIVFFFAAIAVTPLVLLPGADVGISRSRDWVLLSLVVIFMGVMGHLLMTWAQRHLSLTVASLLGLGTVPLAAIGAWIAFDESLVAVQLIGAVIVLAALAIIAVDHRSTVEPAALADRTVPAVLNDD